MLDRSQCTWHTRCYCEENVYRLCQWMLRLNSSDDNDTYANEQTISAENRRVEDTLEGSTIFAVFISNKAKA
ncbi:hypothetical protein HDU67_009808, partial [Dinochytrium kinnereticum]